MYVYLSAFVLAIVKTIVIIRSHKINFQGFVI